MITSTMLQKLRVPAAMLGLASIILVPSYFVGAQEVTDSAETHQEGECHQKGPFQNRIRLAEITSIDLSSNTITASRYIPEDAPVREDGEERPELTITISYDDATAFVEDGEDASESALSVGDLILARGEVDRDKESATVSIEADTIRLWDETEPERPERGERSEGEEGEGFRPARFQRSGGQLQRS